MRITARLTLAVLTVVAAAGSVRAGEWNLTPHGGVAFGGFLNNRGLTGNSHEEHGMYGLSFGYFSNSLIGFEVDFGYSPHFFGGSDSPVPHTNLTSLMGNLVLNGRIGDNTRLYASGGAGLLKSHVTDADDFFDESRNDFGVNVGVGLIAGLGERFAIRADIRYFRNTRDTAPGDDVDLDFGSFDFWKGSAGLSIRF